MNPDKPPIYKREIRDSLVEEIRKIDLEKINK
jgi:hypothetical protein